MCRHRSPRNYDRTVWSECARADGHEGGHEDTEGRTWTDRTMPCFLPGEEKVREGRPRLEDWPTRPVELNHLEAMGICMSLMREEQDDGLSTPQRDALGKVQGVLGLLLDDIGRPRL